MGKSVTRGQETVQTAVSLDLLELAVQKVGCLNLSFIILFIRVPILAWAWLAKQRP